MESMPIPAQSQQTFLNSGLAHSGMSEVGHRTRQNYIGNISTMRKASQWKTKCWVTATALLFIGQVKSLDSPALI